MAQITLSVICVNLCNLPWDILCLKEYGWNDQISYAYVCMYVSINMCTVSKCVLNSLKTFGQKTQLVFICLFQPVVSNAGGNRFKF